MRKNHLLFFVLFCMLFCSCASVFQSKKGGVTSYTIKPVAGSEDYPKFDLSNNSGAALMQFHHYIVVEEANSKLGIRIPEELYNKQQYVYNAILQTFIEQFPTYYHWSLRNLCGFYFVDTFFGYGNSDLFLDAMQQYINPDGFLYNKKYMEAFPEHPDYENFEDTAWAIQKLNGSLHGKKALEFGFPKYLAKMAEYYDDVAIENIGTEDCDIDVARLYNQIFSAALQFKNSNIDFSKYNGLVYQDTIDEYLAFFCHESLDDIISLQDIAKWEEASTGDTKCRDAAHELFLKLNTKEQFMEGITPWNFLSLYIENGGDISGNEYYMENVNDWLVESFDTFFGHIPTIE